MKSRVISLARTPQRLTQFRAANPHINAEVLPAIDGSTVGYVDFIPPQLAMTAGAVGCLLSHLAFWDEVEARGEPMTVFEDDAVVHHRFHELADEVVASLPADWHLCLWGWNFDGMMLFDFLGIGIACAAVMDEATLRRSMPAFQSADFQPRARRLTRFHGTVSYALSSAGAKALRARCVPVPDVTIQYFGSVLPNNGIDRTINAALDHVNGYVCFPPLVATPNERERSTVQVAA